MSAIHFSHILGVCVWLAALTSIDSASAQETAPRSGVRDVTPPGTSRVLRSAQDLIRPDDNARVFENIFVLRDGNLRSGSTTIQLYGIKLPDRKKLCTTLAGARWACGSAAYVALRNLVRAQTIRCIIRGEIHNDVLAACKVQQADISVAMLQQGWAELTSETKERLYVDAFANAKAKGVGLWGNVLTAPR